MTGKEKIIMIKPYERDFSLAIEEYWARGFLNILLPKFGLECPYKPFEIFYVTEENMQIWEHQEAIDWFLDRLLEKNKEGTAFMESVIAEYKPLLSQIEEYWKRGPIKDRKELLVYKEILSRAAPIFSLWYYPGTDDRTPPDVKKLVLELRETDEFFAHNDTYIKDCIEAMGGDRALGNLVFADEFPDLPSREVLKSRASGAVSVDGLQTFVMSLKDFAKENPEYEFVGLFDEIPQLKEFRGQAAFKGGTVKGKVHIVKNQRQMAEVKEGEILVSPMTTPDFLPAMKKAAAFVTDEGGIMCHAAIVARELKKPCIIGTKIATQVLRDGGLVEIDTEKAIVKILNK